uniref:Uncharacterized protein n=1 Tax=Arion vulgaris TaxID=1028688 RepID=A0A0B7BPI8_9EUPU
MTMTSSFTTLAVLFLLYNVRTTCNGKALVQENMMAVGSKEKMTVANKPLSFWRIKGSPELTGK